MLTPPVNKVVVTDAAASNCGSSTLAAAICGGIGGAVDSAIGNEVGGRDGAIIGDELRAAVGTVLKDSGVQPTNNGTPRLG